MRGYIQLASTLAFVLVIYWLATRNTRRATKAALLARVAELEATMAAMGAWADTVEQRLQQDAERPPVYRVQ